MRNIRKEKSFECYSRGFELIKAIWALWDETDRILKSGVWPPSKYINKNIRDLMAKFDLTLDEWHYWAELAREKRS